MFSYMLPHPGPVLAGKEKQEIVYAKNQPQYIALRTLVSTGPERRVMSRWSPTAEQRQRIANGEDIYLQILTFGNPLQPIAMAVGTGCEEPPFGLLRVGEALER